MFDDNFSKEINVPPKPKQSNENLAVDQENIDSICTGIFLNEPVNHKLDNGLSELAEGFPFEREAIFEEVSKTKSESGEVVSKTIPELDWNARKEMEYDLNAVNRNKLQCIWDSVNQ